MGKYDNFNNEYNIKVAQRNLNQLMHKRNPDLYKIDLAKEALEIEKLFARCQIFRGPGKAPNQAVRFSDDHRVFLLYKHLIHYDDLVHFQFEERITTTYETRTETDGVISRGIVGGAIGGDLGALLGMATAETRSYTIRRHYPKGFYLQIFLKDKPGYEVLVPPYGGIRNQLHPTWDELGTKLQSIIDGKV